MDDFTNKKRYAVYSAQQAQLCGTVFWRGVNGEEIELSQIAYEPDGSDVLWTDKECRGEVTAYIRRGQPDNFRRRERI